MQRSVVVIGAGLGGVSAAIALAEEGYRVTICEKNSHIGGKLNVLQKDGFSFDLGPSILTMPHIFAALFERAGRRMEDYVPALQLDLQWRCFFEDGVHVDLYADPAEMLRKNPGLTARDREDFERFQAYARNLYEAADRGYFPQGLETLWDVVRHYGILGSLRDFDYFHTMHQGVAARVQNPHLRQMLDHFVKYVGSSAFDAPAVLNLMAHVQFRYGLWYVQGGMYGLARGLHRLMDELGITIRLETEVVRLKTEDGRVVSASLSDGTELTADIFVSDMEVIPAYEKLLGETGRLVEDYRTRFEPACSGYVLHLGVDRRYDLLAHHNFFFSRDPERSYHQIFQEKVLPDDPTIYLVCPTRTDPSQAPAGCENLKILPHVPYLQDRPFSRDEYARFRESILDKLERMGLEDVRAHILTQDEWTPEDIQKRYYSNRGAIYGVVSDRNKNLGFKAPRRSERYPNLYFVGGSVNPGGGMPMVALSGQMAKDRILRDYPAG
jgi:diapolycopene oxygenase